MHANDEIVRIVALNVIRCLHRLKWIHPLSVRVLHAPARFASRVLRPPSRAIWRSSALSFIHLDLGHYLPTLVHRLSARCPHASSPAACARPRHTRHPRPCHHTTPNRGSALHYVPRAHPMFSPTLHGAAGDRVVGHVHREGAVLRSKDANGPTVLRGGAHTRGLAQLRACGGARRQQTPTAAVAHVYMHASLVTIAAVNGSGREAC